MRTPPSNFVNRLHHEFNGRLRIRWSGQREEWHIEQRVGRGHIPGFYVSDFDDEAVRARDGYAFVMAIRPGDRMPCPHCGLTVKVPAMRTAETRCDYCRMRGRDGRYAAAYFPLEGDALIQYLRRIDPVLGHNEQIQKSLDDRNRRLLASKEKDVSNTIEATTLDHYNRLVGIPQFGYTGKTDAWQ